MTTFTVTDAKLYHCGRMARLLRHEHAAALGQLGFASSLVHNELYARFTHSYFRKAWLIDGQLAALGGVTGSLLENAGLVWLALSEMARQHPVAVVREAKRQLDAIMRHKVELATTILPGDDAAKRLAIYLGFHIEDCGEGSRAYTRAGRMQLKSHIDNAESCRYAYGNGHLILMGYHRELSEPCVSRRLH